jgi:nicotinamidase-related amidase
MDFDRFIESSRPFLAWLVEWYDSRPTLDLARVLENEGADPNKVAIMAVDVTSGFCSGGPLASERVGAIVQPIVDLFERSHELGIPHYVLPQDAHSEDAVEFGSYPPHCIRGTQESATVPELQGLSFAGRFKVIEKDSISSAIGTKLDEWLSSHPEVTTYLVVGDCTDLCVYQLAMHLRLRANVLGMRDHRVIVPINAVDTFDLPVQVAQEIGAVPHDGDLLHLVFLYSMAQNNVEVVRKVV